MLVRPGRGSITPTATRTSERRRRRLYRSEIHDEGAMGLATFNWSRNNGSLVYPLHRFVDAYPVVLDASVAEPEVIVGDWFEVARGMRDV